MQQPRLPHVDQYQLPAITHNGQTLTQQYRVPALLLAAPLLYQHQPVLVLFYFF